MNDGGVTAGVHHTPAMLEGLKHTRPWVLFLTVLGFIGGGLFCFLGLFVMIASIAGGSQGELWVVAFTGLFYVAGGGLYLFVAALLYRYQRAIGAAVQSDQTEEVEEALDAQRGFWKTMGIAVIVSFVLGVLAMVGAIIFVAVVAAGEGLPLSALELLSQGAGRLS